MKTNCLAILQNANNIWEPELKILVTFHLAVTDSFFSSSFCIFSYQNVTIIILNIKAGILLLSVFEII